MVRFLKEMRKEQEVLQHQRQKQSLNYLREKNNNPWMITTPEHEKNLDMKLQMCQQ